MDKVGRVNELNASYAADGYARIKGLSALITAFGVGKLSALNSIARAYTGRAAVVHHSISHGDFHTFAQIYSHVTIAQTRLWDPLTGQEQIDQVLGQYLRHRRPVYIEVPVDLVSALVPVARLSYEIKLAELEPLASQTDPLDKLLHKMYDSKQPIILVGKLRYYEFLISYKLANIEYTI